VARTIGSYQKRTFLETNLGRYIYLVEPILFKVICPNNSMGFEPDTNMLLLICDASNNPSFKNKRFQSYVDEYVENGLHVSRAKKITKSVELHYERVRNRRILKKNL